MISYVNSDLFKKDETKKQLVITYDGGEIRNDKIYFEQFELVEKLCSADNLMFGRCETSELKFKITNVGSSLKDKKLDVSMILNGLHGSPFQVGKYTVYSDAVSANRNYRNIVAYDDMYYILDADITNWYEALVFPMTVKQLRDSLFSYLGITQDTVSLINDHVFLEKTVESISLKGKDIIPYICELNGVFGHIGRSGKFKYVSLSSTVDEIVTTSDYSSASYDDFQTNIITGLQIRQEEGDIGVLVGTDDNKYIIQGNILVYGMNEEELTSIAQNIFNKIKTVQYVPFDVAKYGNPCMEVGDKVIVNVRNKNIESYILERKLSGIQSLKDDYQARGKEKIEYSDISLDDEIKQLKGKSNVLTRNLEETRSEISNLEEETSTSISQSSNSLNVAIKSLEENMRSSDEAINSDLENIRKKLDLVATSDEIRIEFEKEREAGADKVVTSTGYKLDENGLQISKSDSEMSTLITDDGMTVSKSGEAVLTANSEGVDAVNLHATTYLIVGRGSRFEDYYNESGELRTGCFWIGDVEEVEVTLTSISATYTGGSVVVGTSVNSLTGITVKAAYSDGSTKNVTGYTLSGTIKEGTNVITVSYGGKTTTFNVTGYLQQATLSSISATYTGGSVPVGTSVNSLTGITVTAHYSDGSSANVTGYTLSGTIKEGSNTITVTYSGKTTKFTVTGYAESTGGEDEIVLGTATTCIACSWMTTTESALEVTYADSVEVVDGAVALVSSKGTNFYQTTASGYSSNKYDVLLGKYIKSFNRDIYYIDPESTYTHNTNVSAFVKENIVYNIAYKVSVAG